MSNKKQRLPSNKSLILGVHWQIRAHYREHDVLPTVEYLVISVDRDGRRPGRLAKIAEDVYRSLERRGIVTPEGKFSGRRHLTEAGFEHYKKTAALRARMTR